MVAEYRWFTLRTCTNRIRARLDGTDYKFLENRCICYGQFCNPLNPDRFTTERAAGFEMGLVIFTTLHVPHVIVFQRGKILNGDLACVLAREPGITAF